MNNTDKLLRAFIEASGFEIEETPSPITKERREFLASENMLFTLAIESSVDYKVTKRASKSVSMQILHHKKEISRLIKDNENI